MKFRKLFFALFIFPAPALEGITSLVLPEKITIDNNDIKDLSALNSALQLLYNIKDLKELISAKKLTFEDNNLFIKTGNFFDLLSWNMATTPGDYEAIYKNSEKTLDLFSLDSFFNTFFLRLDPPLEITTVKYEALSNTLQSLSLKDTSNYIAINVKWPVKGPEGKIDITKANGNELVGLIMLRSTAPWEVPLELNYDAFVKENNQWHMFLNGLNAQGTSPEKFEKLPFIFGETYNIPVVLIYKKAEGSKESETKLSKVDPLPDFAKAMNSIMN